jgi:hypothetical protein
LPALTFSPLAGARGGGAGMVGGISLVFVFFFLAMSGEYSAEESMAIFSIQLAVVQERAT